MMTVREACVDDLEQVRDVFAACYGECYPYSDYCDIVSLTRLVYADGTILLVAVDQENGRVLGTASVVFGIGAYNDLVGEFGRLVVHPDSRGRGIGNRLMQGRIERVQNRLHVGLVENRSAHTFSQRISTAHDFVPVGFIPMKLLVHRRESVGLFVRHFGDALDLRRNNPRVIPEVGELAHLALDHCDLPGDCIIDDRSAPYPHDDGFSMDELQTDGYTWLLRIERGRLRHREVFGPVRLHYGLFQIGATHSHYLLARRGSEIAGGVGFMIDTAEKAVRIFELISHDDAPVRFLLESLISKCQMKLGTEYIEIDVSAYAPRMQRTLLELSFEPVGYIPASVFHEVERLDAIKMARVLVPLDLGPTHLCESLQPIADAVIDNFTARHISPRISQAAEQIPLFSGLNDEQRTRLATLCVPQQFPPGTAIFRQGDSSDGIHLVLTGDVELHAGDGSHAFAHLHSGQCLGETSLLCADEPSSGHSATAIAKNQVETATLSLANFAQLVRRRPDIGVIIYRNLASDVSRKLKETDERIL